LYLERYPVQHLCSEHRCWLAERWTSLCHGETSLATRLALEQRLGQASRTLVAECALAKVPFQLAGGVRQEPEVVSIYVRTLGALLGGTEALWVQWVSWVMH
jgi:hypothetical protein